MATHMQVAHRWAQDDANAREIRGFNIFFERREGGGWQGITHGPESVIFSYGRHFPIAAFQTDANGRRVVLMTTDGYSVSTSKHITYVSRAIPSGVPVFRVPHVSPMHKKGGSDNFHADNLRAYLDKAAGCFAKSKRARVYGPMHVREGEAALREARAYADAFRVKFKVPETLEAASKASADIAAKQQREYEKARKERERKERERMAQLRLDQAEAFKAWLEGEGNTRVPSAYDLDEGGSVYLRKFGDELQTSRGASVPWEHAVKAFRFIKLCRERGEAFHTNGRVIRVGHFTVSSIDEKGNMLAGCHYFAWERIAECAQRFGVFDAEASSDAVETRA